MKAKKKAKKTNIYPFTVEGANKKDLYLKAHEWLVKICAGSKVGVQLANEDAGKLVGLCTTSVVGLALEYINVRYVITINVEDEKSEITFSDAMEKETSIHGMALTWKEAYSSTLKRVNELWFKQAHDFAVTIGAERQEEPKKPTPLWRRLLKIAIVLVVIIVIFRMCASIGDSSHNQPNETTEEVNLSNETTEEVKEPAYIADTDASEYFSILYTGMYEDDTVTIPEPTTNGEFNVYEGATQDYKVYIESSAESDEIHYVKVEVLNRSEDVSGTNFLIMTLTANNIKDLSRPDAMRFVTNYVDARSMTVKDDEAESNLGTNSALFKFSASNNSMPILEIIAQ